MFKKTIQFSRSSEKPMQATEIIDEEVELLEDFNDTKVEPLNFVRKSLLDYEECLSYL